MPNALELPRMLRAVIPLMRARDSVVNKLVALGFLHTVRAFQFLGTTSGRVPGFSSVIGALNDLAKPRTGLRCVYSARIDRRTFHVINFPTRKMGPADFPTFARAIGCQDERALSCADQNSDCAHDFLLFLFTRSLFSAIRVLTSFFTNATGNGLSGEKRSVPLLV